MEYGDLDGNINMGGKGNYGHGSSEPQQKKLGMEELGAEINTLDEPICTTIMRDLRGIGFKLKYVLLPRMREEGGRELRNWDLWGPLLLCLLLALTLSVGNQSNKALVFQIVFIVVWCGAFIVTINGQLLGGKISFFQSVCVLGYCIFPLNIGALIVKTCPFLGFVNPFIALASFAWATMSSIGFMSQMVPSDRKALAVFPVCLFYLFLCWFIIL